MENREYILETPKSSKYIIKFASAKKEKDLLKYRDEMDAEYDAILDELHQCYQGFVDERTRKCKKLNVITVLVQQYLIFSERSQRCERLLG